MIRHKKRSAVRLILITNTIMNSITKKRRHEYSNKLGIKKGGQKKAGRAPLKRNRLNDYLMPPNLVPFWVGCFYSLVPV